MVENGRYRVPLGRACVRDARRTQARIGTGRSLGWLIVLEAHSTRQAGDEMTGTQVRVAKDGGCEDATTAAAAAMAATATVVVEILPVRTPADCGRILICLPRDAPFVSRCHYQPLPPSHQYHDRH